MLHSFKRKLNEFERYMKRAVLDCKCINRYPEGLRPFYTILHIKYFANLFHSTEIAQMRCRAVKMELNTYQMGRENRTLCHRMTRISKNTAKIRRSSSITTNMYAISVHGLMNLVFRQPMVTFIGFVLGHVLSLHKL